MHNVWYEVTEHKRIVRKKVFFKPVPDTKGQDLTISKTFLNTPIEIAGTKFQSICEVCVNRYYCWNEKRANRKKCHNWMATSICKSCTHYPECYKVSKRRCDALSGCHYPGYSGFLLDRDVKLAFDPNHRLADSFDLAIKIGIKNRVLTWLLKKLYFKDMDLYHAWTISKNGGGQRMITAPKRELKSVQRRILDQILSEIPYHDNAFGFIPGRNIVSNARHHLGKNVVVSMDIQDFFPSIKFPRVYGVLRKIGFQKRVAGVITSLCTWEDALPQGAPTSPALSNLVAYRLDQKLSTYAGARSWSYTRYADDLTFSSNEKRAADHLVHVVRKIVQEEGFQVNDKKTKIMRPHKRQWVTGLVANEEPNVIRWKYRQLRAAVHNAATLGLTEAAKRQKLSRSRYKFWVEGNLAFHNMVNPDRIADLVQEWEGVQ